MTTTNTTKRVERGERGRVGDALSRGTTPRDPAKGHPRSGRVLAGAGVVTAVLVAVLLLPTLSATQANPVRAGSAILGHDRLVRAGFNGNFTLTSVSVVANVTYATATTVRTLTGNMTGTFLAYESAVIQANGSVQISGTGTFVGTILGSAPGLARISWANASGIFGISVSGIVHLGDGQKGLQGIHGSGLATVLFTGGTAFDGSYAFHLNTDDDDSE